MPAKSTPSSDPLISIVVPVYNVEAYLDRCISSVIHQSYQNLEILLIDDGSTDGSLDLCKKWKKQDSRIRILHQNNHGISVVRNVGIKKSRGDYIAFIDSDDYVEPDYISEMYRLAKKYHADISTISHDLIYPHKKINHLDSKTETCLDAKTAIVQLFYLQIAFGVWGKLYTKEVLSHANFPAGKSYEDGMELPNIFLQAKKIAVSPAIFYHYMQNQKSITHAVSYEKLQDLTENEELKFNKVLKTYPDLKPRVEYAIVIDNIGALIKSIYSKNTPKSYIKKCAKRVKSRAKAVLTDKDGSAPVKLSTLAVLFGYPVFKVAYKTYLRISRTEL